MNVNDLFPSKFLKAHDLGGKSFTLTIRNVTLEDVGHGAEKESKLTLAFEKATKMMLLNRTNAMIIASMYGPETDAWKGKAVIVYSARVKAFGAWHDALRIKEQIPARNVGAAQMTEAMQEDAPLDDENDLLDVDEGQPPTIHGDDNQEPEPDDDADGDPADLWEPEASTSRPFPASGGRSGGEDAPATASSKDKVLSAAQLTRLNTLGTKLHPAKGEWDVERPKYVEFVTKGAISSAKQLQPGEADALIAAMERKLTKLAAEVQATGATRGAPIANGKVAA